MFPLFIAHVVFWAVLLVGARGLGPRVVAVFALLWIGGYVGARWVPAGEFLFASYAAVLDIVLVLIVFKGDVSLR